MFNHKIESMVDVKAFFIYLANKGQCYHPDDNAGDIGHRAGGRWKSTFTKAEAENYDSLMLDCFTGCNSAGVDIYELMMEISDSEI